MEEGLLENFTRQHIEAQAVPEVIFGWQGGEPTLMGLDFFKRALELQREYAPPNMRVLNTLQTNGTLLDDEWCRFLKENEFLVGLSIDGPRELHDAYRVDKGGRPTFDRVVAGLNLLKKYHVEFNVLVALHAMNADEPLRVYRFLRDEIRAQFIQLIPIVERRKDPVSQKDDGVTDRSITAEQYGSFLNAVFDEWVRHDVGRVFVQIFDAALAAWAGENPGVCVFQETCGVSLAVEHNGDVYACDHFVDPEHLLGNVQGEGLSASVSSAAQRRFGQAKHDTLPKYCLDCEVRFICNGACPKDRFAKTPEGEPGLNYLCRGYRDFFRHIAPAMRFMAHELRNHRPPANVKAWMALRDKARGATFPNHESKRSMPRTSPGEDDRVR